MKLNKIMLAAALTFCAVNVAQAAGQGSGTVTFTGSIIDAPCSINPESVDQTVGLGEISNVALAKGGNTGESEPRGFKIKLENCDTATLKSVTTTFSGGASEYNSEWLGLNGTATGAGIIIASQNNGDLKLGVPSAAQTLVDGNNTLQFSARLKGGGTDATITPGTFQSVADFTLAYQ
ncbi:type 1 fimbrial protein [Serratia sp. JSRIV001]|uniref:fimbrial protein n=1 Tax=Serratia sp. JSRIV001 TaxID=2831893 RepID=UPI000742E0C0|nr:fimbrial protein [Serratia sp. JSRIV001]ALX95764.1 fimbria A protein [Serratia fonticola]UAN44190.1 type 1 fimbrial protein [Serratia sp. JSRIV001]